MTLPVATGLDLAFSMTTMEKIADARRLMQKLLPCPDDVKARIATLRVPADDGTVALSNGHRMTTNWRTGPSGGGGGRHHQRQGPPPMRKDRVTAPAPRYGNRGRVDASVEERMMDRIRDKMNKFSMATYDAIKAWLCQLLDSGETDFLTDFITLVFEKAASEPPFCELYARLITELREGFPHLDHELKRIFGEFMGVFVEANEGEGEGPEYAAFLALRERRKYRRGYSAFLSEIAKLRVISTEDVLKTCNVILEGLLTEKVKEGQQLLCEEYADCLTTLMKRCAAELQAGGVEPTVARVKIAMEKAPSLSNKARFALMDLTDIFA